MTIRPARCGQSYPSADAGRVNPARCPVRVAVRRISLGPPPSLHYLRCQAISDPALFGGFFGTTQQSDFPAPWLIGVRPKASRCALHSMLQKTQGPPGSRAKCFRACTGSGTARGSVLASPMRQARCGLRHISTASAPRTTRGFRHGACITRLNTRPARTPVNASPTPSRECTHDSEPP